MSTLKVEVVKIDGVEKHPNADRLDIVQVKGWNCVTGKDVYKPGDECLYIPIDSLLPEKLEKHLFPEGSKIKLTKSRIKTIKIRQAISQGMVVDVSPELVSLYPELKNKKAGDDVTKILGVTKYEPPAASIPEGMRVNKQGKHGNNPDFTKYTDIENFKNHPAMFREGEPVYITEKLHGTSARFGLLPSVPTTFWQKLLKFFGLLPKLQFCYGSRNVQLQGKINKQIFYDTNVYGKIAKDYGIVSKLSPGEILYGEIVGSGIQANYTYGCKEGEHAFYAYDLKRDGHYVSPDVFLGFCRTRNIPHVPILHRGEFSLEDAKRMTKGDSTIGGQKVREGIVIKPETESTEWHGRKILKLISDDYLLKDQTEFH